MSNGEGGETLVYTSKSKDSSNLLRKELINNFPRVWVYVFNIDNKKWDVKVASNWGSKLDKTTLASIETFVKEFKNNKNAENAENEETVADTVRPKLKE